MKFTKFILLSFFIYFNSYLSSNNLFGSLRRSSDSIDEQYHLISKDDIVPMHDFKFYLYQIFDTFLSHYKEDNYYLSLEKINDTYKQNMYSVVLNRESLMRFVIDHKIISLVRLFNFLGMDRYLTLKERKYFNFLKSEDSIKRVYSILNAHISKAEALNLCFGQIVKYDFYNLLKKHLDLLNINIIDQLLEFIKFNKSNQPNIKKIIKILKNRKKELYKKRSLWRKWKF